MQVVMEGRKVGLDRVGQGTPLLLMHAFPLDRSMFQPQLEGLQKDARVLTFDVPGMGESEGSVSSMEDIADVGARVLDEEGIEKAVVGGVSMGGYASFAFARRYPERLLGLVLANTRAVADSEEAKAGRRDMAEAARRLLPKLLSESTRRERQELVERVKRMVEAANPKTIAQLLDALAKRPDSTDLLPRIEVPALVLAGEEDAIAAAQESEAWSRRIPRARHVLLAKAGHLSNLEAPESFNREVGVFLSGIAGGG